MSVSTMLTVATKIAKGQKASIPAMSFSDWPLFCRCLKEAKQQINS